MHTPIPSRDPEVSPVAAARRVSLVLYTLYACSFFTGGLTGLVAILINHIKYGDVSKTLYGSHFRWQMRTFWLTVVCWTLGLAGVAVIRPASGHGAFPVLVPVLPALIIVNVLWVIYRLIRGSLACIDGRRMPV